jgi:hypothetical protein
VDLRGREHVAGTRLVLLLLAVVPRADGAALYFEDGDFVTNVLDLRTGARRPLPRSSSGREHVIASVILR